MDGNSHQGASADHVLEGLDRSLSSHLERLTGTSLGINGLPLGVLSVACIVLLVERTGKDGQGSSARALDREGIRSELREMGLEVPGALEETLDRMAGCGYMEEGPDGDILAGKPAVSMARLLDHAFPGMPGMNLVAYIAQTMEEALSGRKTPEEAEGQLEQMFRLHGVSLKQAAGRGKPAGPARGNEKPLGRPGPTKSRAGLAGPGPRPVLGAELRDFLARREAEDEDPGEDSPEIEPEPREVDPQPEAPPEPHHARIEPVVEDAAGSGEEQGQPEKEPEEALPEERPEQKPGGELQETGPPVPETAPLEQDRELPETASGEQTPGHGPLPDPRPADEPLEQETLRKKAGSDAVTADTEVEERVAALGEQLSMECPLCRKNFVETRTTATGRTYYMCPDKECMFISWGRPHHLTCPRCGNPFLVEAGSGEVDQGLKCPRATCGYRLPGQGEEPGGEGPRAPVKKAGRKVVKRKGVRRKR